MSGNALHSTIGGVVVAAFLLGLLLGNVFSGIGPRRFPRPEFWAAVFAGLLAIETGVSLYVLDKTDAALHSAAKAANDANKLNETVQRPWVFNDGQPSVNQFVYTESGALVITILLNLRNAGHTPAQDVFTHILYTVSAGITVGPEFRDKICHSGEHELFGITVFPSDRTTPQVGFGQEIAKDQITVEKLGNEMAPYVFGCTAYKFSEGGSYHHTPFACIIVMAAGGGVPLSRKDLKPNELRCEPLSFAQFNIAD